jgi:pimeloyl-ACP methyl ester carboxylesterase
MGSYLARYFAVSYPDEVVGLLLIDPSPDKMYDDYTEQEYQDFKEIGDKSFENAGPGPKKEWEAYLENRKYVADKPISDDIPMFILSATEWDFYDYHKEMMNKNYYSRHLKIEGGHGLHQEQPDLIIRLVEELVETTAD